MSLYRKSELLAFLDEHGMRPRKGLSQNFLIDGNIIAKLLEAAEVGPGDHVLDVGAGPGAITEALLAAGARVTAIEKDEKLASLLNRLQSEDERLRVIPGDILDLNLDEICEPGTKVVANPPYQISTPIVTRLLPRHDLFERVTVMMQEEVARRYTAQPGGRDYGSITVFLNYHATPSYCFKVSRGCFFPAPRIDVGVVDLKLHTPPPVADEEAFFSMVRKGFGQRRKTLRRSLEEVRVSGLLEAMGLDPMARPERLSLEHFLDLYARLTGR